MADFAIWGTAIESGLRWAEGAFMAAYTHNRESANDAVLEGSPVGSGIEKLMVTASAFEGTMTGCSGLVDVCSRIRRLASQLFRRHVGQRARNPLPRSGSQWRLPLRSATVWQSQSRESSACRPVRPANCWVSDHNARLRAHVQRLVLLPVVGQAEPLASPAETPAPVLYPESHRECTRLL